MNHGQGLFPSMIGTLVKAQHIARPSPQTAEETHRALLYMIDVVIDDKEPHIACHIRALQVDAPDRRKDGSFESL